MWAATEVVVVSVVGRLGDPDEHLAVLLFRDARFAHATSAIESQFSATSCPQSASLNPGLLLIHSFIESPHQTPCCPFVSPINLRIRWQRCSVGGLFRRLIPEPRLRTLCKWRAA